MIPKLRRKFIIINMALVCLVLLIVFAAICFFSYQGLRRESYDAMRRAIAREPGMAPPVTEIGGNRPQRPVSMLPIFSVVLDKNREILSINSENVTVSDAVAAEAAERALASDRMNGILFDLKLRYLLVQTPEGMRIAFADMERELDSMASLMITLLLVGSGGLIAFFFISLFLSRWALRPTEKAWEQQRRFVADASHELKTPLTVILANTGILLSNRQQTIEQQVKWVEHTRAEANRMKKLTDDLLFLAKSDAAQMPVPQARLNLSNIVWSCLLPFESVAFEQGIALKSDIAPDIPLTGDEGQLKQLIVILLDNACKYAGNNGAVTLTLERIQEKARLTVNNTGAPIPADQLQHIFERFYRVDGSRARKHGGYGLGLAIAQVIAENHQGNISVESSEQAGTTFTCSFRIK